MEVTAQLRFLRAAPRKVRLVADLIRGKGVQEAVNILHLTNKHAAKDLEKLLKSAIANAENRDEPMDVDRMYVKQVMVDGGPSMKRFRPAPMGRGFRVLKRSSHVTIALDTRKQEAKNGAEKPAKEAAAKPAASSSKPAAKPAAKKTAKPAAKKTARASA
jgi:large subunit ribosomal protein L22